MSVGDPFRPFLEQQGFVVLDGGLATALEARGHDLGGALWSARLLLDDPDAVRAVHTAYLGAGADCITSAGYQASFEGLEAVGLTRRRAEAILRGAVELALEARDAFWVGAAGRSGGPRPIVAASAGPYGAYLADGSEYDGRYGVDREALAAFHRDRLDVLADTDADVIAFETIPSLLEVETIASLLVDHPDVPSWISFTCRDGGSLRDGTPIRDAVRACAGIDSLVAIGVNCTAPRHVGALIEQVAGATDLPIAAYPNSGEGYDRARQAWTGSAEAWLEEVPAWVRAGAVILGGCCRVGPGEIRGLRRILEGSERP